MERRQKLSALRNMVVTVVDMEMSEKTGFWIMTSKLRPNVSKV